jgi:hypothetical protein
MKRSGQFPSEVRPDKKRRPEAPPGKTVRAKVLGGAGDRKVPRRRTLS